MSPVVNGSELPFLALAGCYCKDISREAKRRRFFGPPRRETYPGGELRKLSNDFRNYDSVSVTADSSTIVTVQSDRLANVWVAPEGDAARPADHRQQARLSL